MVVEDNRFRDEVANLKIEELYYIKKLGEGQFGHVFLVQSKSDGALYALKAVSKAQISEQNLEKHTLVKFLLNQL
jgi:cGMP-dependent protein kinase